VNSNFGKIVLCLLMFTLLWGAAGPVSAERIKPFVSDGCSLFPDGTPDQPELWLKCCVEHDRAYWQGGTRRQRMAADEELRQCVTAVGAPKVAALMKIGVLLGGGPYLPLPFRWGFGWPYPRGYGPLSAAERRQVEERIAEEMEQETTPADR